MNTKNPFKPAWWLPGPHLQTLWPTLCRKKQKNLHLERERFELPDGDFLDLDWAGEKGPIVLILHGLEGSVNSSYAQGMLQTVLKQEWRGLFMHFRGCSGEPNRLIRSYHSGETRDLAFLVQNIRKREPKIPIAAIGFSLGGNVLLKWLGETGENNPLTAAIAVSVPFELQKASKRIQEGFSKIYQWHLLNCLRRRLSEKFREQELEYGLKTLSGIKTMWDFDEKVTAPLHGFACAEDYYSRSSSRRYLAKIRVPTLLVQAQDDPFMTEDLIPEPEELPSQVELEVTEAGGHVGFVAGKFPWSSTYWLEERVPDFLKKYL
jgi:predicted alpha/beta-fold hydrolase